MLVSCQMMSDDAESQRPLLLNSKEASALLNIPESWLLSAARRGDVPVVRIGRYVRFRERDLLDWVEQHAHGSES
jgi:excisionase family DNA binding protein